MLRGTVRFSGFAWLSFTFLPSLPHFPPHLSGTPLSNHIDSLSRRCYPQFRLDTVANGRYLSLLSTFTPSFSDVWLDCVLHLVLGVEGYR